MLAEDVCLPKRHANPHIRRGVAGVGGGVGREERDKGIQTEPEYLGMSCEGGKVSAHMETLSCAGTRVQFRNPEECTATGVQKAKWREF